MGRKIRYILLLMLLPFVGFSQYNSIFTCENCRLYNYIPNGVAGYVLTSNGDSIAPSFQVSTSGTNYLDDTIMGSGAHPVLLTESYIDSLLTGYVITSDSNTRTGFATIYYVQTHSGSGGVDTGTYKSAISWYQALKQINDTALTRVQRKDSNVKSGYGTIYYTKIQIGDTAQTLQRIKDSNARTGYSTIYYVQTHSGSGGVDTGTYKSAISWYQALKQINDTALTRVQRKDSNVKAGYTTPHYVAVNLADSLLAYVQRVDSNAKKGYATPTYVNGEIGDSLVKYMQRVDSNVRKGYTTLYYLGTQLNDSLIHYLQKNDSNVRQGYLTLFRVATDTINTSNFLTGIPYMKSYVGQQIHDTSNTLQRTKDTNTKQGSATIYYVKSQIGDTASGLLRTKDTNARQAAATPYYVKSQISDTASTLARTKDTNTKTGAATIYYVKIQIHDSVQNYQQIKDSNVKRGYATIYYVQNNLIPYIPFSDTNTTVSTITTWTKKVSSIFGLHDSLLGYQQKKDSNTKQGYATIYYVKSQGYGTGTVTSIGTGYGVKGGTISTTGTISADTTSGIGSAKLATEYYVINSLLPYIPFSDTAAGTSWNKKVSSIFGLHDTVLNYVQRKDSNVKAGYATIYYTKIQIGDTAATLLRVKDTNAKIGASTIYYTVSQIHDTAITLQRIKDTNTKTGAATIYYVKSQIHDSTQNYQQIKDSNTKAGYSTIYYVNNKLISYVPFADTAAGTSWTKKISSLYGLHDSLLGYAQIKDTNNRKSISSTYNVLNQLSLFTGTSNIVKTGTLTSGATGAGFTLNFTTSTISGITPVLNGGTGVSSLGAGIVPFLQTPTSANLATAVTDETGTGPLVFSNNPVFVSPALGTPLSGVMSNTTTATLTLNNNSTSLASTGYVDNIEQHELLTLNSIGSTLKGMTFGHTPMDITTSLALVNKTLYCVGIKLVKGQIIKGFKWYQAVAGVYTSTGYNGAGLVSIGVTGTLSLVDSCASNTTLFKATANTFDSVAFASTYVVPTTGIYYLYFLYQESAQTTPPSIGQCPAVFNIACMTIDFKLGLFLIAEELTQTILPATRTTSAFTVIITPPFIGVY